MFHSQSQTDPRSGLTILFDEISTHPSYRKGHEALIRAKVDKLLSDRCLKAFDTTKNDLNVGFAKFDSSLRYNPKELLLSKGVVIAPVSFFKHSSAQKLGITEYAFNKYKDIAFQVPAFTIRDVPGKDRDTTDGKVHIFLNTLAFDGTEGPFGDIFDHEWMHGGGQTPVGWLPGHDLNGFIWHDYILENCR